MRGPTMSDPVLQRVSLVELDYAKVEMHQMCLLLPEHLAFERAMEAIRVPPRRSLVVLDLGPSPEVCTEQRRGLTGRRVDTGRFTRHLQNSWRKERSFYGWQERAIDLLHAWGRP